MFHSGRFQKLHEQVYSLMYTLYAESFHTSKVQDLTHILNYIISVGSAKKHVLSQYKHIG